jgi:hypothetical protein
VYTSCMLRGILCFFFNDIFFAYLSDIFFLLLCGLSFFVLLKILASALWNSTFGLFVLAWVMPHRVRDLFACWLVE